MKWVSYRISSDRPACEYKISTVAWKTFLWLKDVQTDKNIQSPLVRLHHKYLNSQVMLKLRYNQC